jgi:UPF0716 protein FxsA
MAELYLLIEIGRRIGALTTIGVVVVTALVGAAFTRRQGMLTVQKIRSNLAQGVMPAGELVDAVLIFAAGIVLITPGMLTDAAGFLLLIPQTRALVKKWLYGKFRQWIDKGNVVIR